MIIITITTTPITTQHTIITVLLEDSGVVVVVVVVESSELEVESFPPEVSPPDLVAYEIADDVTVDIELLLPLEVIVTEPQYPPGNDDVSYKLIAIAWISSFCNN